MHRSATRLVTGLFGISMMAAGALAATTPAGAEVTDPPGRCVGRAEITADGAEPVLIDSSTLQPGDVTTVPRSGSIVWSGELVGVDAGAERPIAGFVKVDLPWPAPDVTIKDWSGTSTRVERSNTSEYSLPSITPRGVTLPVYGEHRENGELFCAGSTKIRLTGSAFASPLTVAALVGLILSGAGLFFAGRGSHPVLGAVTGLLTLGLLGAFLLLGGILPVNSVVVTILPVLGIPVGLLWSRFAPFGTKPS